jgi:hypothetical protein
MKLNYSVIILLAILGVTVNTQTTMAQGCVAIRSTGGMNCSLEDSHHDSTQWTVSFNNRYFKSYKHFVGTVEQEDRVNNGTEVINHNYSTDIFISKNLNSRWSVGINLPMVFNARSSMYEHGGNTGGPSARRTTHSSGLGDVRIGVYRWLLDPMKHMKFNMQAGLGIKLATGDYRFQDYFYKNDSTKTLGPVDQSIQPGDGGTGITTELNVFWNVATRVNLYGNFYYLINPREQNGVSTARGGIPTAASILYGMEVMSVPDQWMIRAGVNYYIDRFTASFGVRREEIPVYDLVGGSNGFRRPGYVVAVEPGLTYALKKANIFISMPYAVTRNRTQSVPDKIRTQKTGVFYQGDAAFANYSVNVGMNIRF